MNKRKMTLIGFAFLILFILSEILFPEFLSNKILSYIILGVGFTLWIHSFRTNNSAGIFSGSFIFFGGIILFVSSSFVIWNPSRMVFPAVLVSAGLASLLTFLHDKKIYYLIFSVISLLLGFNFLYARMSFKFSVFFSVIPHLILGIGIFTTIVAIIFIYLFRNKYHPEENSNELNGFEDNNEL